MNENHFSYFKVENFKKFESFEMNNIGQFNLIVGDNNVGKTSVLEALLIDTDLNQYYFRMCAALSSIKHYGDNKNYLKYFYNINNENKISFEFKNKAGKDTTKIQIRIKEKNEYENSIDLEKLKPILALNPSLNLVIEAEINEIKKFNMLSQHEAAKYRHNPFVPYGLGYREDMIIYYSNTIQQSKILSNELIKNLEIFIPDIEGIEITKDFEGDLLAIRRKEIDKLIPLHQFGEGTIKLFRLLLEIKQNNLYSYPQLMIDEIDTGIHHRRFIPFFKTIIKAAKENNVQLFATTHNMECIKFFRDVFLEEDMKDLQEKARVFRLVEHKDKQVSAYCYNFEAFDHAIENENELR